MDMAKSGPVSSFINLYYSVLDFLFIIPMQVLTFLEKGYISTLKFYTLFYSQGEEGKCSLKTYSFTHWLDLRLCEMGQTFPVLAPTEPICCFLK